MSFFDLVKSVRFSGHFPDNTKKDQISLTIPWQLHEGMDFPNFSMTWQTPCVMQYQRSFCVQAKNTRRIYLSTRTFYPIKNLMAFSTEEWKLGRFLVNNKGFVWVLRSIHFQINYSDIHKLFLQPKFV